ncbi:chemotaxis protein CheW [Herbaspirillum camelliae]|uniref:chemotaxis protein CheW n=1 Tax=Herbaspirillum camelliae TaxID=1892903 RepID=UPI000949F756|nr:chemotaxis protein CheW [Herbaspirillum camelliae]
MPHTKDFVINTQAAASSPSMRSRESLQSFQASLIERMQACDHESQSSRRLAVAIGAQACLIPLSHTSEIVPLDNQALTPVPATRPWFLGLLNLRGNLVGIADLAALSGAPAQATGPGSHALVLAPALAAQCGLLISAVLGLRDISEMTPISKNDEGRIELPAVNGRYKDKGGTCWDELDLAALAKHEAFLQVGR